MRSQETIKEMLEKFDAADESGDLCQYGAGIREALLWVDETSSDEDVTQYLPECEICASIDCSGATGGTCDDAEEEDDDAGE